MGKKAAERAELKNIRTITITLEAAEETLQRIAALLLFAPRLETTVLVDDTRPLPWEDPNDPRFQQEPELEIDYEVVRRSITKHLSAYVKRYSMEQAFDVIKSFGGATLAEVPQDQLVSLDAALEAALT